MIPIITSILPSILATITKITPMVGSAIAKYAPMLVELAGKYLPQIIKTVETLSSTLNVISPNESADELGAKAMSADKKPEDFDKINDYINYLRKDVTIDKATLSEEKIDVTIRQAIGTSLLIKGTSQALDTELTLPFIKAVSQVGLGANVILEIVKGYSNSGLSLDDYSKYIEKTLPIEELDKHSDVLVDAYQKADPSLSTEQAEDKVMDLELS